MYPCNRSVDTVHFALLATYAFSLPIRLHTASYKIESNLARHKGPTLVDAGVRVDTTLSLLTMNFSVMEYT